MDKLCLKRLCLARNASRTVLKISLAKYFIYWIYICPLLLKCVSLFLPLFSWNLYIFSSWTFIKTFLTLSVWHTKTNTCANSVDPAEMASNEQSHTDLPASVAQLDAPSDWRPGCRGFNPCRGQQHSFVEIDHEIFSTVILSLPLIQEGQLSVSGKRMCTILVNSLED